MDYKKLAADLLSGCEENCANCEMCGKAMTGEAWDELEKRLRG